MLSYAPARALTTIPELGPVGAATILSEMGALHDFVHPRQVLKLAGMNLAGSSSAGKDGPSLAKQAGTAAPAQAAPSAGYALV